MNVNVKMAIFSFSALVIYITLSVALIILGSGAVQMLAMFGLFFGGLSQFAGQTNDGRSEVANFAASVLAYVSVTLVFMALLTFGLSG